VDCRSLQALSRRLVAAVGLLLLGALSASADLSSYLAKPDNAFKWELKRVVEKPQGKVYHLHLVSQVWQGITWEHQLLVFEPQKLEFPNVMGLVISGGRNGEGDAGEGDYDLGFAIAGAAGGRIAILKQVPNQPLFNGLTEDALISYTWVKYLETGDEDWVVNFAMAKAAIRALDCLDAFAQDKWGGKPRGYVVLGASKRGWTTYLTGIAAPQRVVGIAPMVFDILNMPVQIQHQRDFWGAYSEEINDYTEKGLQDMTADERGFRLSWMVDPYNFRDRLTMPKLVILGSNDPYWPTDAVNYYFPALPTPRALLIAPNSGHGLEDRVRVLGSVAAFLRLVAKQQPLPHLTWQWDESREGLVLHVKQDASAPKSVQSRVWVARSPVQDFRPAKWEEAPLPAQGDELTTAIARADGRYTAAYGEAMFKVDSTVLCLSTQPRVIAPTPK